MWQISTNFAAASDAIQVSTELRDLFSYSFVPFIISVLLLVILIATKLFLDHRKPRQAKPVVVEPSKKDRLKIKQQYLTEVDALTVKVQTHKISNRHAYQTLSRLIRNFIYEMTEIKVQYYTLSDIGRVNMPILYELVSEYYHPEFAATSERDPLASITKTKQVIAKWA